MKRIPSRLALCLAVLPVLSLRGENAPTKSAPLGVTATMIFDSRESASSSSYCRVFLNLIGDAATDAHSIRRIRVTNARDELGRDLVKPADEPGGTWEPVVPNPSLFEEQQRLTAVASEVARRRAEREAAAGRVTTVAAPVALPVPPPMALGASRNSMAMRPMINLRNPSRQSATIKIIEGEIDLFTPTEANGGILHLDEITAKPGAFVKNEALEAAGVKLMYLTPETYAANRAAGPADAGEADSPWSDASASQFKAIMATPTPRWIVVPFLVRDPNRVVVDLELRAKDGKRLDRPVGRTITSNFRTLLVDAPPPADAQLIVRIASAGSITTHPFKLENLPLP